MDTLSRCNKHFWIANATEILSESVDAPAEKIEEYVERHIESLGENWNTLTPKEFADTQKRLGISFYER